MKTLLILASMILLSGCQTTPQQKEALLGIAHGMNNASAAINHSTQQMHWDRMQNQRRNINCRSYRAGNSIRTNCW